MKKRIALASLSVLSAVAIPGVIYANSGANTTSANNQVVAQAEDNPARLNDDTPKVLVADDSVNRNSTDDNSTSTSSSNSSNTAQTTSGLTQAEAEGIAKAVHPGSSIRKVEREMEHGVLVWSFRFTDGGRVDVNTETGAVMRHEAARTSTSSSSNDDSDDDRSGSSHDSDDDDDENEDEDEDDHGRNRGHGSDDD